MNLCAHTLSSFADGDVGGDDIAYAQSEASSSFLAQNDFPSALSTVDHQADALSDETTVSRLEMVAPTTDTIVVDNAGTFDEMNRLPGYESKIRWLERKVCFKRIYEFMY